MRSLFLTAAVTAAAALHLNTGATPAELADMTACKSHGFPSVTAYQHALPLTSPYGVETSVPIFFPLFASSPLNVANASVTRAVVFLHGLSGDAQTYFCDGMASTAALGFGGSTLVIAPWFGDEQVTGKYWTGAQDGSVSAFWSVSRWLHGGNTSPGSVEPSTKYSTSFDILDALYDALAEAVSSGALPNLELVTIAGFSAGGQLANHYSTMRRVGLPSTKPQLRFIIGDPGSLLYLSDTRPAESCRPLEDTGTGVTCDKWEVPPEAPDCAEYDTYKYGLSAGLSDNLYVQNLDGDAAALQELINDFPARDIRFLFGSEDYCNCNTPGFSNPASCTWGYTCSPNADGPVGCCDTAPDSTSSNALDVTCSGSVQGSNRLQRGLLFTQHIAWLFNMKPFVDTFKGGHDNTAFNADNSFVKWAYSL